MEWQYLQHVVKDCKPFFSPLKDALFIDFLDALFSTSLSATAPCKALAVLPVKFSGLAIYDPLASADWNYSSSLVSCTYLLSVLRGRLPSFHPLDHQEQLTAVRSELQSRDRDHHQHLLTQILAPLSPATRRTILRGQATGAWLTSMPSFYHGTELSAQEFRDALYLCYAESPLISPLTVMAVATHSLCNMALPALLAVLSLPGTMNYVMSWPTLLPELSLPVLCVMNLLFTLVMPPLL